jgi:hypothetical protein
MNHKDISHIGSTVCDSTLVDDERNLRVREEVIKKGQLFESLDTIKFFFQDYDVYHHRPFYVAKSKQRRTIHYEVPDFELQLGCVATSYEK